VIQEYDEAERQYPRSQSYVPPQRKLARPQPPLSQPGGVHTKKLASMLLDQVNPSKFLESHIS